MIVKLGDGTIIEGCSPNTSCDFIEILRETPQEAAAYLDILTPNNTSNITVYDDEWQMQEQNFDLMLEEGDKQINKLSDHLYSIRFRLLYKNQMDKMMDQIHELQEAIIEMG